MFMESLIDISTDIFIFPHAFPQLSMGSFVDIFIFPHSLPQMSMESFHGHFHRYFYFQERMWENKNVCGKFSWTFLQTFVFSQIPSDKCQ
jgi:hypothetical protein